jgi:hypothetical protein
LTENPDQKQDILFRFLARGPTRVILVGPVSLWLRGNYSLKKTEALLDSLVTEGVLRPATPAELAQAGLRHGYYLTDEGRKKLPVV